MILEVHVTERNVRVEFSDGTVRNDPFLYGNYWYIHWTKDGICEIVIKKYTKGTEESCRKRIKTLLNKIGGRKWYQIGQASKTWRSFPPYFGESVEAFCFELTLENNLIPISERYKISSA